MGMHKPQLSIKEVKSINGVDFYKDHKHGNTPTQFAVLPYGGVYKLEGQIFNFIPGTEEIYDKSDLESYLWDLNNKTVTESKKRTKNLIEVKALVEKIQKLSGKKVIFKENDLHSPLIEELRNVCLRYSSRLEIQDIIHTLQQLIGDFKQDL